MDGQKDGRMDPLLDLLSLNRHNQGVGNTWTEVVKI